MVDTAGYNTISKAAQKTKEAVLSGKWYTATYLWNYTENIILKITNNIDFYNILTKMFRTKSQYSGIDMLWSNPTLRKGNLRGSKILELPVPPLEIARFTSPTLI